MSLKTIACSHCDLLISLPTVLNPGQQVICPRCDSKLFGKYSFSSQRSFALSLSALILLIIANIFPFLSIETNGVLRTISLLEASLELFNQQFWLLAILVTMFILVVPVFYLLLLMSLLMAKKGMLSLKLTLLCAKALTVLIPWAMADVFIVGILVALIKVIELADIVLGISFWAYCAFTACFISASLIADKYQIWSWVEESELARNK